MIVNCAAEWNKQEQCFVVNTKGDGSEKNWISQGIYIIWFFLFLNIKIKHKV